MTEALTGQVQSFRIVRKGWGILELLHGSHQEVATVTGVLLGVATGDSVRVFGDWVHHPLYGRQFKAARVETTVPSDASGVIEWLRARLPAVGRKLATQMVERWGVPGIWTVLEGDPGPLMELAGITPQRAHDIHKAYAQHRAERDEMVTLRGWGLTDAQIGQARQAWGAQTITTLRSDPFRLIREVPGFGFQRASEVADRMGMPRNHPSRIRAALLYVLETHRAAGHSFVQVDRLIGRTQNHLPLRDLEIRHQVRPLVREGTAVVRGAWIYLRATGLAERNGTRWLLPRRRPKTLEPARTAAFRPAVSVSAIPDRRSVPC